MWRRVVEWAAVVAVAAVLLRRCGGGVPGREVCDTVRVTVVDTVRYYAPVARDSVVVRYETVLLPVYGDTAVVDTAVADSAEVSLPITQRVYGDSTYRAYVSGFRARLDSIWVFPRREVVTVTNKPKRWGVGLQAGYGFTREGAFPYVGVGVHYTLWRF